jgi:hypothetical protein
MITPERVIELLNKSEKDTIALYWRRFPNEYERRCIRGIAMYNRKWGAHKEKDSFIYELSDLYEEPPKPKTAWDDIKDNMYRMNSVDPNVPQVCIVAAILKKYKDILENKPMKED